MEDLLDCQPNLSFGIHEFDGSIEDEGVQEDVGHCANMAVLSSKDADVCDALHGCNCLGRGEVCLVASGWVEGSRGKPSL